MFREYSVEIGVDAASTITSALHPDKIFVVCDELVFGMWRDYLAPIMPPGRHVLVAPSEGSKTVAKSIELIEAMVAAGVRRDHTVVAVGGGITQDLTAFAASIMYRGIDWVFVPTTLLAQADSCIGSKTSINLGDKKNLVGNFWPPSFAVIDTRFLETLSPDDVKSGIGEMLHFYLYSDSPMTRLMLEEHQTLLSVRNHLLPYIAESLRIKKVVVELDEFDRHERHKFNYGHTFGHALESVSGYVIPHGLAVTVGMDIANYLSFRRQLMVRSVFDDLHALLAVNMPPRRWSDGDLDRYVDFLKRDKKNLGISIGCILAKRPGALVAQQIPLDSEFREMLRSYFDGPWWRV